MYACLSFAIQAQITTSIGQFSLSVNFARLTPKYNRFA